MLNGGKFLEALPQKSQLGVCHIFPIEQMSSQVYNEFTNWPWKSKVRRFKEVSFPIDLIDFLNASFDPVLHKSNTSH